MNGAAYILMVIGILLAKGLGFFRDMVFARTFGATELTDIYMTVFTVVNLIFTGIGTAMQTLVIKNMNKCGSEEEQKSFVASFIRKTVLILAGVAAVGAVLATTLTKLLVPGISPENFALAKSITYTMLPNLVFVVVAYIISGVLQNNRVFFITSIMSLPFNVLLIAALFFPEIDIFTLSLVTTAGWFLHIAVQLPSFYRLGYRLLIPKGSLGITQGKNREVLYIFISNMMFQFCFLLDKIAVSGEGGASTTISYASNLLVTIASEVVVAMSSVVVPSISQNYEEGQLSYVRELIQYIIRTMFAIFTPFVLTVCCFGKNIICLIYERGEFTPELTSSTAFLFALYTLGVLGYMAQELFNKVLYLDARYKYTVIGTLAVIVIKAILNPYLSSAGGAYAVAGVTSLLFTLYAAVVFCAMRKVIGDFINRNQILKIGKILLSGALAFVAFLICKGLLPSLTVLNPQLSASELMNKAAFIIPLLICGAVYIGAMFALGAVRDILVRPGATTDNGGTKND